jgi:hypothetical protein
LAEQVVMAWLTSEFAGGGSTRKVAKICAIEDSFADVAKAMADNQSASEAPTCAKS